MQNKGESFFSYQINFGGKTAKTKLDEGINAPEPMKVEAMMREIIQKEETKEGN